MTSVTALKRDERQQEVSRFFNPLPDWIVRSDQYIRLGAGPQRTLQGIANKAQAADEQGNLIGARGGSKLIRRCGCSRATFFRHLDRLEQHGFVVTTLRGGVIGDTNVANIYAIPGRHGGLESQRMDRQHQRMIRGTDGKLRPEIIRPGGQPGLIDRDRKPIGGGSLKVRRGWSQSETGGSLKVRPHHTHNGIPNGKTIYGAFVKPQFKTKRRPTKKFSPRTRYWRLELADLTDDQRLCDCYGFAVRVKWISGSEWDADRFWASAQHALRIGKSNPVGLFNDLVRNGRWMLLSAGDVESGARRRKAFEYG